MNRQQLPKQVNWLLLLLLVLAFALRIYRLPDQSLWWDEGISLHLATSSWAEITLNRLDNIHPPLYFYLLKIWTDLVGITPFAARYSALLAGWLQVPLIYAVAHRWFGRRAAYLAALLLTVSPLSIIYAQETRVYSLLPLVYLVLLHCTQGILQKERRSTLRPYIGYGAAAWVGVHLHYVTFFVLVYLNLWALVVLGKALLAQRSKELERQRWQNIWRWVSLQIGVGMVSLPWFGAVIWNATVVSARVSSGTFSTEPVPFPFLLRQIWLFHLTGLPQAAGWQTAVILSLILASLLLILLFIRLRQRPLTTLTLLTHWLIPLTATYVIWYIRPFAHPRYIIMIAIGLPLLIAGLIFPPKFKINYSLSSLPQAALIIILFLLSFTGYIAYTFDPTVAKDDMRGVARYLEANAAPTDLILVPDTDWSLLFEYSGETPIKMPGFEDQNITTADWAGWTESEQILFLVDYPRGTRDWQQRMEFGLEVSGTRLASQSFDGLVVHTYRLNAPLRSLPEQLANHRFEQIELIGIGLPDQSPANGALPVRLTWQLRQPLLEDVSASLRLDNGLGWQLGVVDDRLLDENGRPTSRWPVNKPITTYHRLILPAGAPPQSYRLSLAAFALADDDTARSLELLDAQGAGAGQIGLLGQVLLSAPAAQVGDPYGVANMLPPPTRNDALGNLTLLHAEAASREVTAGQRVLLDFVWQLNEAGDQPLPTLQLVQNELLVGDAVPLLPNGLPEQLQAGTLLRWQFGYQIPPIARETAVLQLNVAEQSVPLMSFDITPVAYQLEPPADLGQPVDVEFGEVARLIGVITPELPIAAPEPFSVTLHWQSLADDIERDYVAFVQLLDENGRVLAQSDSQPVQGSRPTSSWIVGEFLQDEHLLTFREAEFSDETMIIVGLYAAEGGNGRLPASEGGDFFKLP